MKLFAPVLGSPLRWLAIAASLTALAAHLPITEDHLEEALYIGILFIVLEVACLTLAVLLPRRDSRFVWAGVVATGALSIAAYVVSRSIGLPQITDDVGRWTDPLGYVAVASESLMVGLGVVAIRGVRPVRPSWRFLPVTSGLVMLVLGVTFTGLAAGASSERMSGRADHPMSVAQGKVAEVSKTSGMAGMSMTGKGYWDQVGGNSGKPTGTTRTYYISADEVEWDYAPHGRNDITGKPFDDDADVFVANGPDRIGSTYRKCLYRGYTDKSFGTLTKRARGDRYLGFLGPVIRAEVGDRVRIVFRNTCDFPASVHMHGLEYNKKNEGAPYKDGTGKRKKKDDVVAPGKSYVYRYRVPQRAGPGPGDGSSVMWMYHSHVDEVSDTYAGLMGPVVVTAAGQARPDGSPKDIDREVFALFSVMNENASPYIEHNLQTYAQPPQTGDTQGEDGDFEESNLMHGINGFVFGNGPIIDVRRGQHVRWYVMSMGTEVDLHTPHWHGNDVTVSGMRMDVVNLLPATMVIADMVPDAKGTWLFHCHVNDHITAGMLTRYRVLSP